VEAAGLSGAEADAGGGVTGVVGAAGIEGWGIGDDTIGAVGGVTIEIVAPIAVSSRFLTFVPPSCLPAFESAVNESVAVPVVFARNTTVPTNTSAGVGKSLPDPARVIVPCELLYAIDGPLSVVKALPTRDIDTTSRRFCENFMSAYT
jgi:hypothetical protein